MLKKAVSKANIYIRWLYTAIIRTKLCYGAVAWGHISRLDTKIEQRDKLNRLAATMIIPVGHRLK